MTTHVPTLETCQKLKAVGFPQDTEYGWRPWSEPLYRLERDKPGSVMVDELKDSDWKLVNTSYSEGFLYAAPILTEILEQLPVTLKPGLPWKLPIDLRLTRRTPPINGELKWDVWYGTAHWNTYMAKHDLNPAEAAALLWLEMKVTQKG